MTDLYFGLKFIGGVIAVGIFVLIFLLLFLYYLAESIRNDRIEKYLVSIGYKRVLIDVASVGNNHTLGYERKKNDGRVNIIRDYELKNMTLREIKKKYV